MAGGQLIKNYLELFCLKIGINGMNVDLETNFGLIRSN